MRTPPRFSLAGKVAALVALHVLVTAATAAAVAAFLPHPAWCWPPAWPPGSCSPSSRSGRPRRPCSTPWPRSSTACEASATPTSACAWRRPAGTRSATSWASTTRWGTRCGPSGTTSTSGSCCWTPSCRGRPSASSWRTATGRILFANRTARDLLGRARPAGGPVPLRAGRALQPRAAGGPGRPGGHAVHHGRARARRRRTAPCGGRSSSTCSPHTLHIIERLTPELRRREVEVWKQAIRVMNHELNNSLAPIRSLAHSARQAAARPEHAGMLEGILATIEERATHLAGVPGGLRTLRPPAPAAAAGRWPGTSSWKGCRRSCSFRLEGSAARGAGLVRPRADAAGPDQPPEERPRVGQRSGGGHGVGPPDRRTGRPRCAWWTADTAWRPRR